MGEFKKDALPSAREYIESQGLKIQGRGKWITTECRLHGGSDSMRWNLSTGGWICMSCGESGGDVLAFHMKANELDFVGAARALGAWEEGPGPVIQQKPKPLPAGAALEVLAFEALFVAIAAGNLANGILLTDDDRQRLRIAAARIATIQEAYK